MRHSRVLLVAVEMGAAPWERGRAGPSENENVLLHSLGLGPRPRPALTVLQATGARMLIAELGPEQPCTHLSAHQLGRGRTQYLLGRLQAGPRSRWTETRRNSSTRKVLRLTVEGQGKKIKGPSRAPGLLRFV